IDRPIGSAENSRKPSTQGEMNSQPATISRLASGLILLVRREGSAGGPPCARRALAWSLGGVIPDDLVLVRALRVGERLRRGLRAQQGGVDLGLEGRVVPGRRLEREGAELGGGHLLHEHLP